MSTLVIGAGWAGLAAAVELARQGEAVTLVEASRQLGGRARAVRYAGHRVDNGQHILLGAYQSILRLLQILDLPESRILRRTALDLMYLDNQHTLHLKAPYFPAPFHLLWGLLSMRGLSIRHRLQALRGAFAMYRQGFRVQPDLPLQDYLKKHGQSSAVCRSLWYPLCLSALNTPPEIASTAIFMRVIQDAFFGRREASDMLLPIVDLGTCIPEPARDYIERHGGSVRLGTRVRSLHIDDQGKIRGVQLENSTLLAENVIIATGLEASRELIGSHGSWISASADLYSLPICTLYLQYSKDVSLGRDFIGLLNTTTQWLFDRGRLTGERGLIAAVISGPGEHMNWDAQALTDRIIIEIAQHFPAWPKPTDSKLIRERRATFAAETHVDTKRPSCTTPIAGLWLAGDYTATGYPGTLEGATRSGLECAQAILQTR